MSVAARTPRPAPAASQEDFELQHATLTLMALVVKTGDPVRLLHALEARYGAEPPFDLDPIVLDFSGVPEEAAASFDIGVLAARLYALGLVPVGVDGGPEALREAARASGLGETAAHRRPGTPVKPGASRAAAPSEPAPLAEARLPAPAPEGAPAKAAGSTLVIDRPLRSGQQVYARDADLVVLAVVNFGAEVIADGHVHVYAPLRGRAIAGARGNAAARIFSTCMEPQLVAIAGSYRAIDAPLQAEVLGRPAQVRLDGGSLVFAPLGS
jgi:septum site-determining protein MinC